MALRIFSMEQHEKQTIALEFQPTFSRLPFCFIKGIGSRCMCTIVLMMSLLSKFRVHLCGAITCCMLVLVYSFAAVDIALS